MNPPTLFRTGDVLRMLREKDIQIKRHTWNSWVRIGLVKEETWTEGGHRLFGEEVFERIERIIALRDKGLTLSEIQHELADEDGSTAAQGA